MRVAHGVIDQEIGHVVAVGRFGAGRHESLEGRGVHAVHEILRQQRGQDRLARDADLQTDQIALRIETTGQLGHRDRMVLTVRHVLFARPDELDRRARHLLGDQHGLADIIRTAAPAEATAQQQLVDVALGDRQARGFRRGGEGRLTVLRAAPDLALVGRVARRGVHRLHGDVVLVGEIVDGLDLLGRAGDRPLGIPRLVADEGLVGVEPFLQHGVDAVLLDLAQLADIPFRGQRREGGLGMPVGVGDHDDGVAVDRHDLLHTRHLLDLGGVEALQLAADHRASAHGGDQHAGHGVVHAVDLLAGDLVDRIEPLQRLAGDLPVLGILELHLLGRLELGRCSGDRAVGELLVLVGDDAGRDAALRRRNLPLRRRGRDQHLARHGAAFADILVAFADAAAAAGREVLPDAVACQVLARRGIFPGHLVPVAVELFGHELAEAGERALPHLGACDANHDLVVGMDDHPGIEFLDGLGVGHAIVEEGHMEAQREATGDGGGTDQEVAPAEGSLDRHGVVLPQAFAAAWIASRTC